MENWLEVHDWMSGLEILSLDFIRPVYGQLGIEISPEETLRGLARDTLKGKLSEDPSRLLKPPSSDDLSDFYTIQVPALLRSLEAAFGQQSRHQLEYWIRYVACSENHNPWTLYEDLITSWASNVRKTGRDEIGISTTPAYVATELRAATDVAGPKKLLCQQSKKLLTDWDFQLFSERGLLEIPDGSEFFPFVDAILLAIRMRKFQLFWKWLVSYVSSDDLQAIAVVGKKRAQDGEFVYCDSAKLPFRE